MLDACGPSCEYRDSLSASWSDALVGGAARGTLRQRRGCMVMQSVDLAVGRSLGTNTQLEAEAQVRKMEEELWLGFRRRCDGPLRC